jgi:outer membrane protein assembly factor BamB
MQRFVLSVLFVAALQLPVSAQEWTRFRGPNGTGVSDAKTVPTAWSDDDYNWSIDLPGTGHSSPVTWGTKLFVTACNEESSTRLLLCISTTDGSVLWEKELQLKTDKKHKNNSFASSTPCVNADHVIVAWHSKTSSPLIAYNHDGNEAWQYEQGPYLHGQGAATSPIVYKDMVVIANDQKEPSFLLAVDAKTGKERWKIPREGKRACYSTPCAFHSKGRPEELVFTHCYEGIIGVDPASGKQNWHIDVFGRASQRALSSPVFTDELVMATSGGVGGETQLVAVQPGDATDGKATEAWRTNKQTPHVPTPLIYKDWVFMWSDQGIASCLDKVTGDVVWKHRVGGNYFGSPVCVAGKLYGIDLDGNVVVIAASDKYELLGKVSLGQGSKATPAVSDGVMYLRTESKLFSLGG